MPCEARPLPIKHYDYSAKHIQRSVENSLKLLQTDYLDLLLLHRPSPMLEIEAVAQTITKLKKEGKVKTFGVSNFTPAQIQLLQKEIPPMWNQIECSLTHEIPLFDGTLDFLNAQNIGTMAWSPLGSYFKEDSKKKSRIKKCLDSLCQKYNCSEDQLLLAWLLSHPSKIYPVVGTTSTERMEKALQASTVNLELTDWFLLLEASQGKVVP